MIPGRGRFAFHIPPESVFTSLRNPYSQFPGTLIHMPRNTQTVLNNSESTAFIAERACDILTPIIMMYPCFACRSRSVCLWM